MRVVFFGLLALIAAACGGGGPRATATPVPATQAPVTTSAPGELPSAQELCGLLTTEDWSQFGYVTAASPEINSDGPGTAYCVYAGTSGATGGLEFDAFVAAAEDEAQGTYDTIISGGPEMTPLDAANADSVAISTEGEYAVIVARTGRFTFSISLPTGDDAENELMTLANTVVTRSEAYR